MGPIEFFTEAEMQELIYKLGDVILDMEVGKEGKQVPPKYDTGLLMLKTAHSFLADHLNPPATE